jgi:hypothetical protein
MEADIERGEAMREVAATRAVLATALLCLLAAGCAQQSTRAQGDAPTEPVSSSADAPTAAAQAADAPPGPEDDSMLDRPPPPEAPLGETVDPDVDDPCREPGGRTGMLDRTQRTVYWTVCGATRWFDGFFGDRTRYDATVRENYGRVGLGGFYDQRDGLDIDYRFRAQLALPAAEDQLRKWQGRFKLGRGTDRELIEDRAFDEGDTLPGRFEEVEDSSWLLGVGFQRGQKLNRGFDLDAGIRFRLPPDPFVKGRFFRNWDFNEDTLVRFRQTVFWTNERGFGTTSQADIDKLLSQTLLARWSNSATVAEDREGLDWSTAFTFFQGLSNRRAFTYRAFLRGETGRLSGPPELRRRHRLPATHPARMVVRRSPHQRFVSEVLADRRPQAEPRSRPVLRHVFRAGTGAGAALTGLAAASAAIQVHTRPPRSFVAPTTVGAASAAIRRLARPGRRIAHQNQRAEDHA